EGAGPFPVPTTREPDAFWATLTEYYLRVIGALASSPQTAALARGWATASTSTALERAQKEMEAALMPWFRKTLAVGRRTRAVRKDAPAGLLLAFVFGVGRTMDLWLLTQGIDE